MRGKSAKSVIFLHLHSIKTCAACAQSTTMKATRTCRPSSPWWTGGLRASRGTRESSYQGSPPALNARSGCSLLRPSSRCAPSQRLPGSLLHQYHMPDRNIQSKKQTTILEKCAPCCVQDFQRKVLMKILDINKADDPLDITPSADWH